MKKYFSGYHLAKLICLLMVAGILYLNWGETVYATENSTTAVTDTPTGSPTLQAPPMRGQTWIRPVHRKMPMIWQN